MLNCPERITYHRLSEVCARHSAQVYAKVRLADVLPVEGSGLSEGLFEFALQAHYDFVITDLTQKPLFAVEFDGPGHSNPTQVDRDAKKNQLSHRFNLPLLRILADDLHRSEWRLDRLTEVAERWFDRSESESGDRFAVVHEPVVPPFARGGIVADRPLCPLCGSGMVVKDGKYGTFLSCARFPECRGSCDLPVPSAPARHPADREQGLTANSFSRQWLIAGLIFFGFILMSLALLIARPSTERPKANEPAPIVSDTDSATARQMNLIGLLIRRRRWDTEKRDAEMERILGYSRRYSELSKQEASKLITAWDDRRK